MPAPEAATPVPAASEPRQPRDPWAVAPWWAPLTWVALLLVGLLSPMVPAPPGPADGIVTAAAPTPADKTTQGAESPTPINDKAPRDAESSPEEEDDHDPHPADLPCVAHILHERIGRTPGSGSDLVLAIAGRRDPQRSRAPPRN